MTIREQLEQLRQDPKKIILVLALFGGLVYADFNFVVSGQIKAVKAVTAKASSLKADIRRLETELQALRQQAVVSNALPAQEISLLADGEMPFLLKFVSETARSSEVKVMQISSLKAEVKDRGLESRGVVPVSVKLEMVGGYHNVMAFINKLENAQYAFFIDELKLSADPSDSLKERVSMTARTYVKK